MTLWRRHDGYVLRSFLSALGSALLFLTALVIVYDLAERLDRLPDAWKAIRASGRSPAGALVEYYATMVPFLWLKILPVAALLAAGLAVTWLARANELAPLVNAGVPSRRVLRPILLAGVLLVVVQWAARETLVPWLSRRHDDLQRVLGSRRAEKVDGFSEVPHLHDAGGGRLSAARYVPSERRIEEVWLTFAADPAASGAPTATRYPLLSWSEAERRWVAERGGERWVLDPTEAGASTRLLDASDPVPLKVDPSLLELTLRQSAAMGLSSAEIAELARGNPDKARFTVLLHQQRAASVATLVLLLIGLPLSWHLRRRGSFAAFGKGLAVVTLYFFTDTLAVDLGVRGALAPVVAAWFADVVFGALGITLLAGMET
jgi:lipopolysaccharide export system permease protein